jgi:hypothetical protein
MSRWQTLPSAKEAERGPFHHRNLQRRTVMASPKNKRPTMIPRRPEKKIGPFHNGLGIAIWLNSVETEHGPRYFRSITIAPRRYRDAKTGEWKNATSFRPADLATLELALAHARQYIISTPLPGQPVDGEEYEELHVEDDAQPAND